MLIFRRQGQALIEYLLVLVVTVAIIIGLAAQFFSPFGKFIDKYMGSYVTCLLEMGELPSLGNPNSPVLNEDGCDTGFEEFTLAGGRPPKSPGGGGNSSGKTTGGTSSKSNTSSSASSNDSSKGKRDGGSESTSHSAETGGSGRGGKAGKVTRLGDLGGSSSGSGGKAGDNGDEDGIPEKPGTSARLKGTNVSTSPSSRDSKKLLTLSEELSKKILKNEKPFGRSAPRTISSIELEKKEKVIPVTKPEEKLKQTEEDRPFTIGDFLKYFLIIGIIIALIVFIGGQLLQISKSSE